MSFLSSLRSKRLTLDFSSPSPSLDLQTFLATTEPPQHRSPPPKSSLRRTASTQGPSNGSSSSVSSSDSGLRRGDSTSNSPPNHLHPTSPESSPDRSLLTPPQTDYMFPSSSSSSSNSSLLHLGTGLGKPEGGASSSGGGGRGARGGGLSLPQDHFEGLSLGPDHVDDGRSFGRREASPARESNPYEKANFSSAAYEPSTAAGLQRQQLLASDHYPPTFEEPPSTTTTAPTKRPSSFFGMGKSSSSSSGSGGGMFSRSKESRPSGLSKPLMWEDEASRASTEAAATVAPPPPPPAAVVRNPLRTSAPKLAPRPWDHASDSTPLSPFVVVPSSTSSDLSTYGPPGHQSPEIPASQTISTLSSIPSASTLPSSTHSRANTASSITSTSTAGSRNPTSSMPSPLPKYPAARQNFNQWLVLAAPINKKPQPPPTGPAGSSANHHPSLFGSKKKGKEEAWKKRVIVLTAWKDTVPSATGGQPTTRGGAALHIFKDDWKSAVEEGRMPLVAGTGVSLLDVTTGAGGKGLVLGVGFGEQDERGGKRAGVRSKDERDLGFEKSWVIQFNDEATLKTWIEELRGSLIVERPFQPPSPQPAVIAQFAPTVERKLVIHEETSELTTFGSTEAVPPTSPPPSASGPSTMGIVASQLDSLTSHGNSISIPASSPALSAARKSSLPSSAQPLSAESTVDSNQITSSRSSGSVGASYSFTFDPQRFPLPQYPCLRASLLPIAVLATHVHKKSQAATDMQGPNPQPSISSMFGKTRGDANAYWKGRIIVLTSFQATTTTVDGSAEPQKATYGCLHLFKTEGASGVEVGRMPLSKRVNISLVDPLSPEGVKAGEGRKHVLSISVGGTETAGKKAKIGEGGVRGKDERELGADKRWIIQLGDEITLRAWVTEIKSLLLIQRAELMGLGDAAREHKASGVPFDGDLDIALAKLASSRVAIEKPASTALTFARASPPIVLPPPAEPTPASLPTRSPPPPPVVLPAPPPPPTSIRSHQSTPPLPETARSTPPPERTSSPAPLKKSTSNGPSFASRFGREAPSTITSPILVGSSNPLVSQYAQTDPRIGGGGAHDADPSFQKLQAFLKTEHGLSATSKARIEDGTFNGVSQVYDEPSPTESEASSPTEEHSIEQEEILSPTETDDFPQIRNSLRSERHPYSVHKHQAPSTIESEPFKSTKSGKSSHKRDSSSSNTSQFYAGSTPLAGSDQPSPSTANSSYFSGTGYLNEFLERKPSTGSATSSQRTSSTGRSRERMSVSPRPPSTNEVPLPPLDRSDSSDTQRLVEENQRLRNELALLAENAKLRAELEAMRRGSGSSDLSPPISRSNSGSGGRLSPMNSPTGSSFNLHPSQGFDASRRGSHPHRGAPAYPPPTGGLPPPPPSSSDHRRAPPSTLSIPATRTKRRGSDPPNNLARDVAAVRRPSLGLETLPEFTVSPPGTLPPGYKPVSSHRYLPPAPAPPTGALPPVPSSPQNDD